MEISHEKIERYENTVGHTQLWVDITVEQQMRVTEIANTENEKMEPEKRMKHKALRPKRQLKIL